LEQEPDIDPVVYYCSRKGVEDYVDPGFGKEIRWDVPLLEDYEHRFLPEWQWRKGGKPGGFSVNPSIVRELRVGCYDALWVHGYNSATHLLAIASTKLMGIPLFIRGETHLLLHQYRPFMKRLIREPFFHVFYHLFDACLPIGTRNSEFYQHYGVDKSRLFPVPYTVNNEFFTYNSNLSRSQRTEVRKQLGLPVEKSLVLFASKLTPRKRPIDLLCAYEQVKFTESNVGLVYIGSGSEEAILRQYVQDHALQDVFFLGFRNQSELPAIYAAADVFVLPSENEPWGLVVNEVMCAGLPVIATEEIGSVADLVTHGRNGFLYQAGDIKALTNHLQTVIQDDELRQKMGKASLDRISQWSYEECVSGIRSALQSMAK